MKLYKKCHKQQAQPSRDNERRFEDIIMTSYIGAVTTADQEVADSTPIGSATFFRGNSIMEYFYGDSLPSANSRRALVSFWRKNVHITG